MNSPFFIKIFIELLFVLFISVSAIGQGIIPLEDDRNYKTAKAKVKSSTLRMRKSTSSVARNYKQPAKMDSVEAYQLVLPKKQSLKNRNYKNR
jgi:hypothetical protein